MPPMRQDTFDYEHNIEPLRLTHCARHIALTVALYAVSLLACCVVSGSVKTIWHYVF
jgi:hypothetical protein